MTKPQLPARSAELGEALRAVWRHLAERIDAPIAPSEESLDRRSHVLRHAQIIASMGSRLQRRLDELIEALRGSTDATNAALYRALGKLEAALDDFVESHRELVALQVSSDDAEWQQLIAAIYRHHLHRIRDFLQEMSWTLSDSAAAESRMEKSADNYTLSLMLDLGRPPEMTRLEELMRADREKLERISAGMARSSTRAGRSEPAK